MPPVSATPRLCVKAEPTSLQDATCAVLPEEIQFSSWEHRSQTQACLRDLAVEDWAKALTKLLASKYDEARARELAEDAIARAQGAIMIMGLTGDEEILRRAGRDIVALLD